MGRLATQLLQLVAQRPRQERPDADAWWRECLLRARAISEQLPLRVTRWDAPEPGSYAAAREEARKKKIEEFLNGS